MTATRSLLVAIALTAAAAGSAFAQEATPDSWLHGVQSTKTRAEVSADLAAARASGLIRAWSDGYIAPVRSNALRAEVQAQTVRAIQSGELAAINAEVYGYQPTTAVRISQVTR